MSESAYAHASPPVATNSVQIGHARTEAGKEYFTTLDGMRGVAAIAVGIMHASHQKGPEEYLGFAVLAVDFFFCLSGFVVSHAYDERLRRGMSIRHFMGVRLARLYPLIFLGVILGGATSVLSTFETSALSVGVAAMYTMAGLFLIPLGLAFHQWPYPVNNVIWSLFFELAANAAFPFIRRLPTRLFIAGSGIIAAGLFAAIIHYRGVGSIGFFHKTSFLAGFLRVGWPFLAGVAIHRFAIFQRYRSVPAFVPILLMCAMLYWPSDHWTWHLPLIFIGCPLLVVLGAWSRSKSAWALWALGLLGELSYPFYLLHMPVIRVLYHMPAVRDLPAPAFVVVSVGASLLVSFVAFTVYDRPIRSAVRGWLNRARGPEAA